MDRDDELKAPLSARGKFQWFVLIYVISIVVFGVVSEILRLLIKFL